MADEALVQRLARSEPRILNERQAYKRAVIRMALDWVDTNDSEWMSGLQAELDEAIRVAWKRGARDWVLANHPSHPVIKEEASGVITWQDRVVALRDRLGRDPTLDELLAESRNHTPTPEEEEAQRESFVRAMMPTGDARFD